MLLLLLLYENEKSHIRVYVCRRRRKIHRCMKNHMVITHSTLLYYSQVSIAAAAAASSSEWVNEDRKFSSNVSSSIVVVYDYRHHEWRGMSEWVKKQKGTKWLWNFLMEAVEESTWRCYQIIMLFTSNKTSCCIVWAKIFSLPLRLWKWFGRRRWYMEWDCKRIMLAKKKNNSHL